MRIKRVLSVILLTVMLGSLCACNNQILIGSVMNQTGTSVSGKYSLFTGQKNYTIKVKEGETLDVLVKITTEEGKIGLTIKKADSDPEYTGNDLDTCEFTVTLNESGTYKVTIDAEKHKGGYSLDWSKK